MNFIFIFYLQSAQKSIKEFNREEVKVDKPQKQDAQYHQEVSQSKQTCDFEMQFPNRLLADLAAEPKIEEVGQSLEQAVDARPGNVCSLPGENEEGEPSSASSDWSSTILGTESPRMSQGKIGAGGTLDFGKWGRWLLHLFIQVPGYHQSSNNFTEATLRVCVCACV